MRSASWRAALPKYPSDASRVARLILLKVWRWFKDEDGSWIVASTRSASESCQKSTDQPAEPLLGSMGTIAALPFLACFFQNQTLDSVEKGICFRADRDFVRRTYCRALAEIPLHPMIRARR